MQSKDKSSVNATKLVLRRNMPSNDMNQQSIPNEPIFSPTKDGFTLLLRSSFILGFLAILFVAAIYYGIINP
ncbi:MULTISPECIES: hypothetical protein [unclassified Anabaena]|uniref:hypothetical protein n=1 Tax=unclassified Anabaena TaxID=2619674 RepID=UPI002B1F33A5|nr:hypothetical protein [Anabaena sp. UHCC 0399]MEA5567651.1 hypothetical protein [Anabaena sp. UHCC 0399]